MADNDDQIIDEVLKRIKSDYAFKDAGLRFEKGKCPDCDHKELYTYKASPWILTCGRVANCGKKVSVRERYPDIFDTWSNRFKATEADPNAAADAYLLRRRGLNLRGMRGAYAQETYHDSARKITTATVRFPLPNDTWWERLIDQPGRFDRKARFKYQGSYAGYCWQRPDQSMEDMARASDIWIAEGIFDAWALADADPGAGLHAVSAMSCNNWPEHFLADLRATCGRLGVKPPRLVFAFDPGKAGTEYTRKFVARAIDEGWKATAAQPVPEGETAKLDWNDLKNRGALKGADIENYLWNGRVLLVEDAVEKAILLYEKHEWVSFSFVHKSRTWWAWFNPGKIAEIMEKEAVSAKTAAKACAEVSEIANCAFRTLYWQRDDTTDESQHYMSIDFEWRTKPFKAAFSGAAISSGSEFKKRLASVTPGGMWEGSTRQLDRIIRQQVRTLKVVNLIDFLGYCRDNQAWVLDDFAVHKGEVFRINNEDYFELGKAQLKLRSRERTLDITYDADNFDVKWLPHLWTAFRENGVITLTFWVMSFFAEQIRTKHKGLGFLEMSGLPGTGKTTLIEFLWKLTGRENYEGFDPSKSTLAGYARNMGRVANLPVVFMEADRTEDQPHSKKWDWNAIKPAFNGKIGRETGVKNGGNETSAPKFRGALVIEQNAQVNSEAAVMERIMALHFTKDGWTNETKAAANTIEQWPIDEVSGTIIHLIKREADYLARFAEVFNAWEDHMLKAKVRNSRLRLIHAELHAGLDAMAKIMPVPSDIIAAGHKHIDKIATTRDRSLESDHPIVSRFWEAFDYLEDNQIENTLSPVNLSRSPWEIAAINLTDFEARCRKANLSLPTLDELKKHLRTSKTRKFIDVKPVNCTDGKSRLCWVFQQPGTAPTSQKGA